MSIDTPCECTYERGIDIESYFEYVAQFNSITYFHNLKFDGRFILDWLLRNGYVRVDGDGPTFKGQFRTLISDMGAFYSITVRWNSGNSTEFRDSYKKIPLAVSNIPKAFGLEESKGELDYEKPRPVGYQPTEEEWDYVRRDVFIVAMAMKQVLDSGMKKLTVASDSLAEYKRLIGDKLFSRRFPVMSMEMDTEIRRAYRGGFTYADARTRGRLTGPGVVLDVNSLYPSVMYNELLPYGEPEFVDGIVEPTKRRPLTIFSITFTAKLKPGHIPCIQIKGSSMFGETEYLTEVKHPTTLMVTNVDFDLYCEHYDLKVLEWGGGWRFHGATGMFDHYIDKWSAIKIEATGGQREIAKLHLNSLYGKFATNPNVTGKVPILEDNIVRLKRGIEETKPPVYTAMGVFITSYARDLTIRAAQENYDVFAYADTDSLHLLTRDVPKTLDVHPTRMGAWKREYGFERAYYVRPKAYLEQHADGTYTNRFAGLPEKVSRELTFDDLKEGRVLTGKLTPRAVPGGVVLRPVPFMLKGIDYREDA